MALNTQKLVKITEKNLEEAKRIINNLKVHLREIEKRVEEVCLAEIKERMGDSSEKK